MIKNNLCSVSLIKQKLEHYNSTHQYLNSILSHDDQLLIIELTKHIMPITMKYTLAQRAHWIFHDMKEFPKCVLCQKSLSDPKYFCSFNGGYKKGCCAKHSYMSSTTMSKGIQTVIQHNSIDQTVNVKHISNIFQLPSIKQKIKQSFTDSYGEGITNPGQIFNRRKGYESYLKNAYVMPMFTYDEYNEQCKHIDRYHNKSLKWKCKTCGYEFNTNVKRKGLRPDGIHRTSVICPKCFRYKGSSYPETQLYNFVKDHYNGIIERCNRTILSHDLYEQWNGNHEIDIWIPNIKCAIEFNGTYYHMDPRFYKPTDHSATYNITAYDIWQRDALKYEVFKKLCIKYIVIWQYDWDNYRQKCETDILNLLKM